VLATLFFVASARCTDVSFPDDNPRRMSAGGCSYLPTNSVRSVNTLQLSVLLGSDGVRAISLVLSIYSPPHCTIEYHPSCLRAMHCHDMDNLQYLLLDVKHLQNQS